MATTRSADCPAKSRASLPAWRAVTATRYPTATKRRARQFKLEHFNSGGAADFNRRQAEGELPARIAFGEVVDGQYRFMQAQGVEPLCLLCHGKGISDATQAALDKYYPDDQATGYSLDQVRGAISLSRPL